MSELEIWYEENNEIWIKDKQDNPFGGYLDWSVSPKIRTLVIFPDSSLRELSREHPVNELLNEELIRNKLQYGGIGLSAIQIGVPWRVFVAQDRVFVNPTIVNKSDKFIYKYEGCLSVPGKEMRVKRYEKITLKYEDEHTHETKIEEFDGLMARAIQHEMDHLDGKLIIDNTD